MKRLIPLFVAALLLSVAGIYSLFADNNGSQFSDEVLTEEWFETPANTLQQQIDAGNRRPQLTNPATHQGQQNAPAPLAIVSEKQKRKYRIQITCDRSQAARKQVSDPALNDRFDTPVGTPMVDPTTNAPVEFFADELSAPVWLFCDELEMKTTQAKAAAKQGGYDLKIAGPFMIESPGLSIRGMGLTVQNGEMAFTNGKIRSGGFTLDVEKCKLPFLIKSLQIDSNRPMQNAAPAPIATF